MKYEIVEFRKGNFGIRRRNFLQNIFNYGGKYYDLTSYNYYFWSSQSQFFQYCQTDDIEFIFRKHSELTNNVVFKVIK